MLSASEKSLLVEPVSRVFEQSITWEGDLWKADPFDVDEIHRPARRKFLSLLDAIVKSDASAPARILLFHGQSGAGKTHLIRALRSYAHRANWGYFGYAQMTPDVGNYGDYFLARLVSSLEKPYDPLELGESGLMRLSRRLVEDADILSSEALERLREVPLEPDDLARLVTDLADEILISPRFADQELDINIVRALLYLQRNDPRIDGRVRQYLFGRRLNEFSQAAVAGLDPNEGDGRAFEIIESLGRLMYTIDSAALVFCIDQVEDLRFFEDYEERFTRAVRDLIQIANRVPSSLVLISCLGDFYAQVREHLPQSFIDRVEKAGPVRLGEARSSQEARLIVMRRLVEACNRAGCASALDGVGAFFGETFFDELAGLSTRRLLEHVQSRWRELMGLGGRIADLALPAGGGVGAMVHTADMSVMAVKDLWERFALEYPAEIPSDEDELLNILIAALHMGHEEHGRAFGLTIESLTDLTGLVAADVSITDPTGQTFLSRVFICNKSSQGGGLKRQIEKVMGATAGRSPLIVRASDFPPNSKSMTAQVVRRYLASGGRRLTVPICDWERMITLEEFRDRHRTTAGFDDWLKAVRPASEIGLIALLLRLAAFAARCAVETRARENAAIAPELEPASPEPEPEPVTAEPAGETPESDHGDVQPRRKRQLSGEDEPDEPDEDAAGAMGAPGHAASSGAEVVSLFEARTGGRAADGAGSPNAGSPNAGRPNAGRSGAGENARGFDVHQPAGDDAAARPDDDGDGDGDNDASGNASNDTSSDALGGEENERLVIGRPLGLPHEGHGEEVALTKSILRRHAAVLGGTGSGKTTLALSIIEQLLMRGVPAVLIDRKGDLCSYANPDVWRRSDAEGARRRALREELGSSIEVAVYTPGRTSGRPISITLLPNGIAELPEHEQTLLANVSASALGEMLHLRHSATHQRQSGILAVTLKILGARSVSEVTLTDLIALLESDEPELEEITQRMDGTGKLRRDLVAQLDSLRHRNAALFEGGGEPLTMEGMLGLGRHARPGRTRLSVIYTGFLGDNENVLFWVAQFLSEALRFCQRNPNESLQAVIMIDEADLYIPANARPATSEPLQSLLKRARSAGIGLMLATQSPGDLDYKSRDQIASWFIGRVREDTALRKLKAAFSGDSGLDPALVLPRQQVGEFHLIQEGTVLPLKANRSLIRASQVPFDRIEQLARENGDREVRQLRLALD